MAFLTEGRDFRLMPDAAWKHRSMPFDAHFDGDFWFYFRTRKEMARLQEPLQVQPDDASARGPVDASATLSRCNTCARKRRAHVVH